MECVKVRGRVTLTVVRVGVESSLLEQACPRFLGTFSCGSNANPNPYRDLYPTNQATGLRFGISSRDAFPIGET